MNKKKIPLIAIIGVSIFGSGIAYAQYGNQFGALQHDYPKTEIQEQLHIGPAKVMMSEAEKNNQTLLVLAIGIPALVTGVIILLLTKKRKSHDSQR